MPSKKLPFFALTLFSLIFVAGSYWLMTAGFAHAASDQTYTFEMPLLQGQNNAQGLGNYVRLIFTYGLTMAGIAALFSLVYGGLRYTTSGGGSGVAEAKKWIFAGLSGVVLLLCSWLILYTINPALVSFKEPNANAVYIAKTVDNYIPAEVGYQKPTIGSVSSTLQNLSQYQGQLNSANTTVVIDKSDHAMYIYKDGQLIAETSVNIGVNDKNGTQLGGVSGDRITPVGNFTVTNDIRSNPNGVYSGEAGSNMGPAFIGLSCADQNGNYRGIGIHGSGNDSLGSTFGCVRVNNADVMLLYQNLRPGTSVQIRN